MTATLKTTIIQEPSSATPNITLDSSGGVSVAGTFTAAISGLLIRSPQILTSGTSYTTPSNCRAVYVELVGGGAGGNNAGAGDGGGGGAYAAKYFAVSPSTSYTYGIGSGGAGGAASTGGSTTFTAGSPSVTVTAGGGVSGAGGTATNGDINVTGGAGRTGYSISTTTVLRVSGDGGGSFFGQGGKGVTRNSGGSSLNGNSANGYGGGGSGGCEGGTGGSGTQGVIRIWEYT